MVDDRDLSRLDSPYRQWRASDDADGAGSGSTLRVVIDAINGLLRRVTTLEQKLGDRDKSAKPERVLLSKRPASGQAPPTGETLHRRGKLVVRS